MKERPNQHHHHRSLRQDLPHDERKTPSHDYAVQIRPPKDESPCHAAKARKGPFLPQQPSTTANWASVNQGGGEFGSVPDPPNPRGVGRGSGEGGGGVKFFFGVWGHF